MSLFAHITTPDSAVLAAMFCLGLTVGAALTWIVGNVLIRRKR